jgi:hypothetical protein
MLKRFFAWIGSLMRRRHFIAARATIPPPPAPGAPGRLAFNLATQSGLLVLLEDI